MANNNEGCERYVGDPSGGFRPRLALSLPHKFGNGGSGSGGYISLQQVIAARPGDLTVHDRLLVTITLAQSLLHLYYSPWIRDWGIGTIYYFTAQEHEEVDIGWWTPYLVLQSGNTGSGMSDRNRDVYRLGCLLLQLGGLSADELHGADGSELAMQNAITRVYRSTGSKNYVEFVKSCLDMWGNDRGLDLTRDDNLGRYLAHLGQLKKDEMCFSDWSRSVTCG